MSQIDEQDGGRIYFSGAARSLIEEDEIHLTSVGVDIGSSTAHLMFSQITLERLDTRYVVAAREVIYASKILLTPYRQNDEIDTERLAEFIEQEYLASGVLRSEVDTGALILTGVAVRRRNARAIAELFAAEAGKFVSVSAGDSLETIMAANGSGAVAASAEGRLILNIDVGGGTTKLAVCQNGEVIHTCVVEAGARLVVTDADHKIIRLEEFGRKLIGADVEVGDQLLAATKIDLAGDMAARIIAAMRGRLEQEWLRLSQLPEGLAYDGVVLSGGVSEFFYNDVANTFGDFGQPLAAALKQELIAAELPVLPHVDGIRATVVGASQYTVQVSGSTVYLDPIETLPLRNLAAIRPNFDLGDVIDPKGVAAAVRLALHQFDLIDGSQPVAVALPWTGSASFARLEALSAGLVGGLGPLLEAGHPVAIVTDGDVGGLIGMHIRENGLTENAVISIDGIVLSAFDFVDIGEVISATGAVPVVIKSLVFPGQNSHETRGAGDDR